MVWPSLVVIVLPSHRDHTGRGQGDGQPHATRPIGVGASRNGPDGYFLEAIRHHVYRGDTALHIGAAAHHPHIVVLRVARGAVSTHRQPALRLRRWPISRPEI